MRSAAYSTTTTDGAALGGAVSEGAGDGPWLGLDEGAALGPVLGGVEGA